MPHIDLAETKRSVDLEWHMHEISDGERRRVQIVAGLMAPWDLLLLDEVRIGIFVKTHSLILAKGHRRSGCPCSHASAQVPERRNHKAECDSLVCNSELHIAITALKSRLRCLTAHL